MRLLVVSISLFAVLVTALAATIPGGGSAEAVTAPAPGPAAAPAADATGQPTAAESGRKTIQVRDSRFGRILFDGRGYVLYAFTADGSSGSACSGDCARAWPPLIVTRTPRAGDGARGSLIGTTRRADGRLQATYAGRPLYYYVGDTRPGQILCQNVTEFGGVWLVVRGNGALVR